MDTDAKKRRHRNLSDAGSRDQISISIFTQKKRRNSLPLLPASFSFFRDLKFFLPTFNFSARASSPLAQLQTSPPLFVHSRRETVSNLLPKSTGRTLLQQEVMAEVLLSALLPVVMEKATDHVLRQFGVMWGISEKLEDLEGKLLVIQSIIGNAEERQGEDSVKRWLEVLKGTAYEADDILDEFNVEVMRLKARNQAYVMKKVRSFFSFPHSVWFRGCRLRPPGSGPVLRFPGCRLRPPVGKDGIVANFYSLHSWMGLLCVALFAAQVRLMIFSSLLSLSLCY